MDGFLSIDGVACRACGAVRASRHVNSIDDVCDTCWGKFTRWAGQDNLSIEQFNKWLARNLILELRRLDRFGVTGRCEAVSDFLYERRGFQCALPAIMRREGRRVCGPHGKNAMTLTFVDGVQSGDPYFYLEGLIKRLISADEQFAETIRRALGVEGADLQCVNLA